MGSERLVDSLGLLQTGDLLAKHVSYENMKKLSTPSIFLAWALSYLPGHFGVDSERE